MKKILMLLSLLISVRSFSQIDWSNYATTFGKKNSIVLGIAIPYNGVYDNFDENIVGIAHWNPQYNIKIDQQIDDQTPLYFVYDTSSIYFLAAQVNKFNTNDFEFTVSLNNHRTITSWKTINNYSSQGISDTKSGFGIIGPYSAKFGEYIVITIRSKKSKKSSSLVVYYQKQQPKVKAINTGDNASAFSKIVEKPFGFGNQNDDLGWHRTYTNKLFDVKDPLQLAYNENNILIEIDNKIYRKEALEYAIFKDGTQIKQWSNNAFDNNYILLKNLEHGNYKILIRLRRQRESITEFDFTLSSIWYKTVAFKAAIFALICIILLLFYLFFRYKKQRLLTKKVRQNAEKTENIVMNIHTLLNPHFTFNALNSIQGLINNNNTEAANQYLSSFGALLREVLKESEIDLIPLSKEIENLDTYINLEQLRTDFTYNLHIHKDIDKHSCRIPPFIIQPFIENAIKHGVIKQTIGVIDLIIDKDTTNMLVTIKDNGFGFDNLQSDGFGLSLSKRRIHFLNEGYGEELLKLQLSSSDKGTIVTILFKNWF